MVKMFHNCTGFTLFKISYSTVGSKSLDPHLLKGSYSYIGYSLFQMSDITGFGRTKGRNGIFSFVSFEIASNQTSPH